MRRWAELDRAKGLAIILVVFGHLVAREDPAGVGWYGPLRMVVYLFHMPFFFYLSGYVAVLAGADRAAPADLLPRRAARLLVPFLGFGLAILLGKLALGPFVAVDNLPAGLEAGLWALFWDTGHSPATSVWYLLALFVFSLMLPALLRVAGLPRTLAAGLVLYALPMPPVAYLDRICGYFLFFAVGAAAARAGEAFLRVVDRIRGFVLVVFLGLLTIAWSGVLPVLGAPHKAWMLALGLLGMPALHGLSRAWPSGFLDWLGGFVFPIYLLNTICIGLAKAALLPLLGWHSGSFSFVAAVLMVAGLLGPIGIASAFRHARHWPHGRYLVRP